MDEGWEKILSDEDFPDSIRFSENVDKGCMGHPGRGPVGGVMDFSWDVKNPKPIDYPRIP